MLGAAEERYYTEEPQAVLEALKTSPQGLTRADAKTRLVEYGHNQLEAKKRTPLIFKFLEQFRSVLVLILIGAAVLSILIGEHTDAIVIFIVITINAVIGFFQEFRAEKAMEALKRMSEPIARVVRNGEVREIPAEEVVPGDIITLEEGSKVPADAYLIEANNLKVDESVLTGESAAVLKKVNAFAGERTLSEQKNMLFASTNVTSGNGRGVVVRTGMRSEIGKIAAMVQASGTEMTPLQKRLDRVGKIITVYAGIVCALVLIIGVGKGMWGGESAWGVLSEGTLLMSCISLAVAVIPEGLPIVVVVTLALGVQDMAKRHAIIRRIASVETLGSTTVICTDKTGTLTKNEMTVREIYMPGMTVRVTDEGRSGDENGLPEGRFLTKKGEMRPSENPEFERMMRACLLCNNSTAEEGNGENEEDGRAAAWKPIGDSTENALLTCARKAGVEIGKMRCGYPRMVEYTFDSDLKRMSTVNEVDGEYFVYTKGAPGLVIPMCGRISVKGKVKPLTDEQRELMIKANDRMAGGAMRVLAFAYRKLDAKEIAGSGDQQRKNFKKLGRDAVEKDLVFMGLVGMIDPPRPESKRAIELCKKAGVRVVMITGDQKPTAVAIGKELGIIEDESNVITGPELDRMSDEDLAKNVEHIGAYSMAIPAHKMKVISALKKKGHVVAMTGDGVNDAPALTRANIGIAMGITGTDVAKEASDMVLTDDNFGTIVSAIDGGRRIYNNIRRFIRYQLSTNIGAIIVILTASLFRNQLPLLPAQILWINILMDGPPALALAMEPTTWEVMDRPPIDPKKGIITKKMITSVILLGMFMAVGTLYVFFAADHLFTGEQYTIKKAQTMAFTIFVLFQLFNVFNCRSDEKSLFRIGLFKNKYILWAVLLCLGLQFAVIYVPFMQDLFHTVPLKWVDWVPIVLISSLIIWVDEIYVWAIGHKMDG